MKTPASEAVVFLIASLLGRGRRRRRQRFAAGFTAGCAARTIQILLLLRRSRDLRMRSRIAGRRIGRIASWVGAWDLILRHRAQPAKPRLLRECDAGSEAEGYGSHHGEFERPKRSQPGFGTSTRAGSAGRTPRTLVAAPSRPRPHQAAHRGPLLRAFSCLTEPRPRAPATGKAGCELTS
jgi:hypothetical protein